MFITFVTFLLGFAITLDALIFLLIYKTQKRLRRQLPWFSYAPYLLTVLCIVCFTNIFPRERYACGLTFFLGLIPALLMVAHAHILNQNRVRFALLDIPVLITSLLFTYIGVLTVQGLDPLYIP